MQLIIEPVQIMYILQACVCALNMSLFLFVKKERAFITDSGKISLQIQ